METEIKKKEQTMMCAEYLKFKDKNMKINNDRPTLNNIKIKSLNNQMVSKRENGITLIALVVTIVVLLILAGITISLVFGSNGVIKKAQEANENTKIAQVREQLELAKGPEYIEGNGKYNPDSYFERIEAEGIIGNKDTDIIDNGDGTYEVTTTSGYIFKITLVPSKDNVEDIQIEHIGKVDGPRIRNLKVTNKTTNSITVEVETANAEGATYTYYYKKGGETDWKKAEEIKEKTYTFSGLESNVIYNIKVRVEKDGKAVEKEVSTITGELPEGAVQFSPVEWKNGQASTTITTSETGYTLQYQIGEITEGSWTNTTSGSVIGNLQHGQIVYGRLFDGTNGSKTANIDVQDLEEPKVNITVGEITTNSITVSVGSSDEQWGMPTTPTYNYYIKKSTEGNYQETANYTGTNTSYTFTGLTQGTKYDVKVTTQDKAGNIGTGTLINKTTGEIGGATGGLVEGNIIASNPTWSNGTASITLNKGTNVANNLTIQYQVNGINENKWTTGTNVTGLHHNDTVYARLTDGINNGNYASVDIVDNISPTVNISITSVTSDSIKVKVTASDGQSGLATSGPYKYYLDNKLKTTTISNTYTFTSLEESTTYTLKVTVADNAGKTTTKSVSAKTESDETIAEAFNNGTIKIGDYVKYTPNGANSYNVLGTQSGFLDDNDNLINQTITRDNLNWRVFDIKNGNVRLISETATNSEIGFSGANGYNNAVYIVNDACSTLYRGNNATATNLNNEDIYEKLDTSIWDYTQSQYYGQVYTTQGYSYPNIFKKETNQPINNYSGTLKQNEQPSIVTGYTTGSSLQIKVTTWETAFEPLTEKNYKNSIYFDIIQNAMGRNKAWLASRGVGYQGGTGFFEVNYLTVEGYDYQILYNTSNQSRQKECSLRPIITLNSSVKIITSDKVNDGSSASKAWQIK